MQPKPTSAHRRPSIHVPEDLSTCTHVFVLRGGVQPTLTTPYDGPYRVIERTPEGFRIEFPGRPSDIVALARLRPAITFQPEDGEPSQDHHRDLDDAVPPSPPPPGRRPGPRTRVPEHTDRVTRSTTLRQPTAHNPPASESEPTEQAPQGTPAPVAADPSIEFQQPTSPSPSHEAGFQEPSGSSPAQEPNEDTPSAEENHPAVPQDVFSGPPSSAVPARTFTSRQERHFSNRGGPIPTSFLPQQAQQPTMGTQDQGGVPPRSRVLSFSKPRQGDFSYRRKRPDVSALNAILREHLK